MNRALRLALSPKQNSQTDSLEKTSVSIIKLKTLRKTDHYSSLSFAPSLVQAPWVSFRTPSIWLASCSRPSKHPMNPSECRYAPRRSPHPLPKPRCIHLELLLLLQHPTTGAKWFINTSGENFFAHGLKINSMRQMMTTACLRSHAPRAWVRKSTSVTASCRKPTRSWLNSLFDQRVGLVSRIGEIFKSRWEVEVIN